MKKTIRITILAMVLALIFSQAMIVCAEDALSHSHSSNSSKCGKEPAVISELDTLLELCKSSETVEDLQEKLMGEHGKVVVSNVKVYPSGENVNTRAAVTSGKTNSRMVVRLYYNNNRAWV